MKLPRPLKLSRPLLLGAVLATAAAGLLAAGGCQLGGMLAANFLPLDNIKALYKMPDEPAVVLIDDPGHHLATLQDLGTIAVRVGGDLEENKVVTKIIPPGDVEALRVREPDFSTWPIDKVGQSVHASQVIYVLIDSFNLVSEGPGLYHPKAAARVKVIDVKTGNRVFPKNDPGGYPITADLFYKIQDSTINGATAVLTRALADRIGENAALLFYEHKPHQAGAGFRDNFEQVP